MDFPILKTQRLTLRKLRANDAMQIKILRSDETVNKFVERSGTIDIQDAKIFIKNIEKRILKDWFYWVITLNEADTLIGTICYWRMSNDRKIAEIGYELMLDFQGKGYIQEAIESVIDWGFNEMEFETITAFPKTENKRSVRLLERNNFKLDLANQFIDPTGDDEKSVYYLMNSILNKTSNEDICNFEKPSPSK